MKKIMTVLLCLAICFTVSGVFAKEDGIALTYRQYEFTLTAKGDFTAPVNMMICSNIPGEVTDQGITAEQAILRGDLPVFIKQYECYGTQTIDTPVPQDLQDGSIQVFIDGKLCGIFSYISEATIQSQGLLIPAINAAKDDAQSLQKLISDNREILKLDAASLQFWDVGAAQIFQRSLPILAGNAADQMLAFEKAYRVSTALRNINSSESSKEIVDVLTANANELGFDIAALLKMSAAETEIYTGALHRADFAKRALTDVFREAEIVVACAGAKHVSVLQKTLEDNGAYIGIDASGSKNFTSICAEMMKSIQSVRSYQDILSLFEKTKSALSDAASPSFSGGGGGGGGGLSSGGKLPNQPLETEKDQDDQEVKTPSAATSYDDMDDAKWAESAVAYLKKKNIINGDENGRFRPNASITRAEFSKILACAGELTLCKKEFADVKAEDWFSPYIGACSEAGIMFGTGDGAMEPNRFITRQDAAVMIKRFFDRQGTMQGYENNFSDREKIADYAAEAVGVLAGNGVINGYEDGTFRPDAGITRAESAVILYRLLTMQ